jgi:replicative DNA helicase
VISESSVIGACLIDPDAYWRVTFLNSRDFADGFLGDVFREIARAANAGDAHDPVSLADNAGLNLADLLEIANNTPGSANVESYAKTVKRESNNRRRLSLLRQAISALEGGDSSLAENLPVELDRLSTSDNPSICAGDAIKLALDQIEAAQKRKRDGVVGLPTGIPWLNTRTGGFHGPKLIILAARPSLGKTALAMQMMQAAAKAGHPVGMMSLEMSAAELGTRILAHQYRVTGTALSAGSTEEIAKLERSIHADDDKRMMVNNLPIFVDEDTYTLGGIKARAVEWHLKHKIEMLVVDHLQLVELPSGFSRNDGLGQITRELKIMAKRLQIPILVLCQFSRYLERENRKPKLSDLRDSGNIEQDADIVLALHGDLEGKSRDLEIGLLKNRSGVVTWGGEMIFDGPTQTFREKDWRYRDEQLSDRIKQA